jgi:hypothetical protein
MKSMTMPACILLSLLLACTHIDIFIRDGTLSSKPKRILIGSFEKRNLLFYPFISESFRDALGYEFFKRGYRVDLLIITEDKKADISSFQLVKSQIAELNLKHSSDLFIQGALSERSCGYSIETETSTLITLQLYNRNGDKIGEGRYLSSETLSSGMTMINTASAIVDKLDSMLDE